MKFYCDSCNTKYAISDDKVRGKVLKVRCKHCENIITVRELEVVAKPAKPPTPPSAKVPQTNWHFSVNGQTTGPMGLSTLKAKYAAGEIGDETYVWHDTFDSWKPVANVPIFAEALRQGFARKPRFDTRAYTGVTEAVDPVQPSKAREGVAPKKAKAPTIPKDSGGPSKLNEARLEKLREKLAASPLSKPEMKPLPSAKETSLPSLQQNDPSPFGATLPDSGPKFDDVADPIADTMLPDDINSGFAPMDDISEDIADFTAPKPRDLFDPKADTYGLDSSSDAMPFFPDDVNPTLGKDDAPSEAFTSSKSLLIELDKIKKTDRKKSLIFLFAGVFGLAIIAIACTYAYLNREIEEVAVVEKVEEREAKIIGYSKDEIAARFVQLEDEVLGKEEAENVGNPDGQEPSTEEKKTAGKSPKATGKKTNKTKIKKVKKAEGKAESGGSDDALRKKLLATGSAPIKRPEDMIGTNAEVKTGLSRVQAQAGFKKVSRSVLTCRQRHASRSGKELESAKVKVSVEVLPSGKVSTFKITPRALRHTAFDSCMKSKRETWRFARFGGKPVKINRTFILQ